MTGAIFSECRNYRYVLRRGWDAKLPFLMYVGLNPSTANEDTDDPTIKSITRITKNAGYGGFYMTNLFAWVSPYPEVIENLVSDPVGDNDAWLKVVSEHCEKVVFAWGAFDIAQKRAEVLKQMFPNAYCLGMTKSGNPRHPLYMKSDTRLQLFTCK